MTTHAALLAKLESLIAQWEDEATEADRDYYAEQYDSHRKCASELHEALAGTRVRRRDSQTVGDQICSMCGGTGKNDVGLKQAQREAEIDAEVQRQRDATLGRPLRGDDLQKRVRGPDPAQEG